MNIIKSIKNFLSKRKEANILNEKLKKIEATSKTINFQEIESTILHTDFEIKRTKEYITTRKSTTNFENTANTFFTQSVYEKLIK